MNVTAYLDLKKTGLQNLNRNEKLYIKQKWESELCQSMTGDPFVSHSIIPPALDDGENMAGKM